MIHKDANRDKIDTLPEWRHAPNWARWIGVDDNGSMWWYQDKPVWSSVTNIYTSQSGRLEHIGTLKQRMLESRPGGAA